MAGRIIDADKLKAHYAWWKGGTREMTMDEAKSDFDTIIDLQPTFEPTAATCLGCNCPKMEKLEAEPIEARVANEEIAYLKGYADGKVEPTKHGRWIYDERNGNYYCSECHRRGGVYIDGDDGIELLGNYCGICGAKMDEVEE